jgi:two-component system, OmpR family, sensor histidine kinase YxdK
MKIFIKDNISFVIAYLIGNLLTTFYCFIINPLDISDILYILIFNSFILICFLIYRYFINNKFYNTLSSEINDINQSIKDLGNSPLSQGLENILKNQYNLYSKNIEHYNKIQQEHLMFINLWVHQMKTPLSVIQLHIQNNFGDELSQNIKEESEKLDRGLNMALYFARLDSFQKDFHVEKVNLHKVVLEIINSEKRFFIKNKVFPQINIDPYLQVYTDSKWISFVIQQLIINGVKYSKGYSTKLILSSNLINNKIILEVEDMGVGIPQKDIRRVFDPFFTGENGRKFGESTGIGLYIVKKVCDNLEHKVEIESIVDKGTKVRIIF